MSQWFSWCLAALPSPGFRGRACLLALALAGCGDSAPVESDEPTLAVDVETTHQILEGFGASAAWYQQSLTRHPQKDELYELAFAELGLDFLRFRNRYGRTGGEDSDLSAEVELVERATESLGRSPRVLITSWSPPGTLKADGRERCEGNDDTCTLRREAGRFVYDDFASYWYDSLEHYAAAGITAEFISIQNEPEYVPGSWEGCRFEPSETDEYPGYDQALSAVHGRLQTLDSPPKLLGPEVLGVHYNRVQRFAESFNLSLVAGLCHHLYERGRDGVWDWRSPGPDSYVDEMRSVAEASAGLPLFQTEFQTDDDDFIEGGFETAWLIHNTLVYEGAVAFFYWDLVWDRGGLLSLQDDSYVVRDQYYSMRHFARFTDPGYVRVAASVDQPSLRVSAYLSPGRDQLTVVVLNVGTVDHTATLDVTGFAVGASELYRTRYEPGASETWTELGELPADSLLTIPPRAVVTLVLRG